MFKCVIIVSGPTIEPIDPVRFISNRSSGKSGLQLAREAIKRGIEEIIFITGPTCCPPGGVTLIPVETALEMQSQLHRYSNKAEVIIMSAAVSDYRVEKYSQRKIKKDNDTLLLQLVKNPDLLFELGQRKRPGQILVGYAAETHNILENAIKKFEKKNLDLLVLNEVSGENPAFGTEENQVYLFTSVGMQKLEKMNKSTLAVHIWDEIYKIAESNNKKLLRAATDVSRGGFLENNLPDHQGQK